jgi:hypothetical protein
MRRALWPLIVSLLLQLMAGGAWAGKLGPAPSGHCHDASALFVEPAAQADPAEAVDAQSPGQQADGHQCCAVGLAWLEPPLQSPPPQTAPAELTDSWLSLALRPDLRPPI